jgi:hypothetical protein
MSKNKTGLPEYRSLVSVIPGGTIQFLDLAFNLSKVKRLGTEYFEYTRDGVQEDEINFGLRCLVRSDEGDFYLDRQTGEPVKDPLTGLPNAAIQPTYSISTEKALEPFLDKWVPLPFFRSEGNIGGFETRFRHGPTDWARARVIPLAEPDAAGNTHSLVIGFDTHVQTDIDVTTASQLEGYPALAEADMRDGAEFAMVSDIKHNSWFLALDWMDDWLKDFFHEMVRRKRPNRPVKEADFQYRFEHLARYIAFLELLDSTGVIPKVRLIDPSRHAPIDVDLVLDIGNSRTIGMLIEKRAGESLSLSNGSVLELRDLSRPSTLHRNTFNSYVCFARGKFGDANGYARGAGRYKPSFSWPSVVRVGDEAVRLAVASRREEGQTSMSSPKRYLWDLKPRMQEWRYSPDPDDINSEESPVNSGDFVGFVNNEGTPLHVFDLPRVSSLDFISGQSQFPVTEPRFSRSSLMMFLMAEILSHALVQINSPAQRSDRLMPDIPRRLRRIILTVPPAMSVSERKIFMRWANWAVDVLWKSLEWDEYGDNKDDYRLKPEIKVNLDEASATQLVFVYNEIAEKFSGDAQEHFRIFGKVREKYGTKPNLRVASIDIGGGTTDMVITTYQSESAGATNIIVPHQEFREGFNFAGDDIVKVLIEKHLIPDLMKKLVDAGARNVREDIIRKLGKDAVGLSEKERNLRAQFTQQLLVPMALQILQRMEQMQIEDLPSFIFVVSYESVFSGVEHPKPDILRYVEELVDFAAGEPFSLKNWTVSVDLGEVNTSIATAIDPYLRDLCEVIKLWDCDFLVLSGRPSCLSTIHSILYKMPPLEPSRIIPMSNYEIESWYPFWTPEGKIDDPKTTGVVGAMLSAISEGNLMNFHFKTANLKPASTIRFIGPMGIDKQIRNHNLLFNGDDLDQVRDEDLAGILKFSAPTFVGFRQMLAERWKTTPFYFVKYANQQAAEKGNRLGPYEIHFSYQRRFDDDVPTTDRGENEGILKIEEIVASDGSSVSRSDIELQLKSLWDDSHWLDTGLFEVHG